MDYLARIQAAIDFIEANLTAELATAEIAREADLSPWHFQRVFRGMVGDAVKEYVRRRRLTAAAWALRTTARRILDLALDYQFESQEAFSRAFKAQFDVTPGRFRKTGAAAALSRRKPRITEAHLRHLHGGITMTPKFVERGEMKVVGLGTPFISILSPERNNHILIPRLWDAYLPRAREIRNRLGPVDVGLCEEYRPPEAAAREAPGGDCYYIAGTEVSSLEDVPAGMVAKVVPAGRYAVFTHRGSLAKLEYTMNYIYGSWLPKSGFEREERPDLEVYDERFKGDREDSELDVYIPIAG